MLYYMLEERAGLFQTFFRAFGFLVAFPPLLLGKISSIPRSSLCFALLNRVLPLSSTYLFCGFRSQIRKRLLPPLNQILEGDEGTFYLVEAFLLIQSICDLGKASCVTRFKCDQLWFEDVAVLGRCPESPSRYYICFFG